MPRAKKEIVEEKTLDVKTSDTEKKPIKRVPKTKTKSNPRKIFENVNKVEGLEPSKLIRPYIDPITGKATEEGFMTVRDRVSWFRLVYPKGRIIPETVAVTKEYVRTKASIYIDNLPDSVPIAVGSAVIEFDTPIYGGANAFNSSETCAIGRALSFAGFGTQSSGEELDTPVIDAGAPISKAPDSEAIEAVEDDNKVESSSDNSKAETEEIKPETLEVEAEEIVEDKVDVEDKVETEKIVEDKVETKESVEESNDNSEEKDPYEDFDKQVKYLLENEMNVVLANGCLITYGDLRNKTVREAFVELKQKGKDPIAALSKYLRPETPDLKYALIAAACAFYIDKFKESQAEKKPETSEKE